jgi:hypothetical protein
MADVATWLASPATNDWNTASNWTPATVPINTAFFDASNTTSLSFSAATTSIDAMQFNPGAPAYTFSIGAGQTLTISGQGIINNSSAIPLFVVSSVTLPDAMLIFANSSTAGNASITVNNYANVLFINNSTAGNATINIIGNAVDFRDNSTADNATINTMEVWVLKITLRLAMPSSPTMEVWDSVA